MRDYLKLSMRHLHMERISFDYRSMLYNPYPGVRQHDLGEVVYTLNTSNRSWPAGVSYSDMMQTRNELYGSMYNERS